MQYNFVFKESTSYFLLDLAKNDAKKPTHLTFHTLLYHISEQYKLMTTDLQQHIHAMLSDPKHRNEGFRLLMEKFGRALYWHIRRIVVSHDDAEDVLQETSIKILNSIGSFRKEGDLTAWIYRIATNEALHHLQRQTKLFQNIDALSDTLIDKLEAECSVNPEEAEVIFQKALLTLPTQQRIAFNLRYYDELTYDKIASITGKKVGTLKTNYHYAIVKIKQYIKDHSS